MKKFLLIYLLALALHACGYTPMYANNQKVDFYIENIEFDNGDKDLANFIKTNLNNYLVVKDSKKFKIKTSIEYVKNSLSKNSAGETEEYELSSYVIFDVESEGKNLEIKIKETFKMNNFSDEFEELEYERVVKQTMSRSIASKLIIRLSRLNDN
jgi:outer membrane lipopolysaccharide assembly protein LptE/RlpB